MMLTRRSVALGTAAVATTALALGPEAAASSADAGALARSRTARPSWTGSGSRCAPSTPTPSRPSPIGVPVLGFVSLAMHRAVQRSAHLGASSESAAAARAAHDVLVHYYPALAAKLDGDLRHVYAAIGGGHEQRQGRPDRCPRSADMVRSRADDGCLDTSIHYSKTPGAGIWQPTPPAPTCWPRGWARCGRCSSPRCRSSGPTAGLVGVGGRLRRGTPSRQHHLDRPNAVPDGHRGLLQQHAPGGRRSATRWSATSRTTRWGSSRRRASSRSCTRAMTDSVITLAAEARRRLLASLPGHLRRRTTTATRPPRPNRLDTARPEPNYSDYVSGHASADLAAGPGHPPVLGEESRSRSAGHYVAPGLHDAVGAGVRRVQRPDLGRPALPQGDDRRLRASATPPHAVLAALGE